MLIPIAMIAAGASGTAAESPGQTFDVHLKEAKADAQTRSGAAFEAEIGSDFAARHRSELAECRTSLRQRLGHPSELPLKLGSNGSVQEALVLPDTNMATCLGDALRHDTLRVSPSSGYWICIAIHLKG